MKAFFPTSIVIAFFILAGAAKAVDPECNYDAPPGATLIDPDPSTPEIEIFEPVDVIDATGSDPPPPAGAFAYCTPRVDANGLPYPLTGEPMTCEVRLDGEVLHTSAPVGPGELVEIAPLDIRWNVDAIEIACANRAGEGAAFTRPAIFPATAPGGPYVPGF